ACGGSSSNGSGVLFGDAGPGGGSAICGPNGTNTCRINQQCDSVLGCVDCTSNAQCPASSPACLQGACVQCITNANCGTGTTPACYPATHTCHAACTSAQQCQQRGQGGNQAPLCDANTGACVGCNSGSDCPVSAKICDRTTQQCVQCATNADCGAGQPRCLQPDGRCVACLSNADCGTAAPVCDPQDFTCRQGCTADSQCAAGQPRCDAASARCVQCLTSADCAGTSTPTCQQNQCVQ
ncbi:MAG: hypothetical protein ACREJ3_05255, partial [Polyangiaceae bacterium]